MAVMEELKHFSHDRHPLTLLTYSQRDEKVKKSICYGCGKPISSEPTYACTSCRDFLLHQKCAELPTEIKHPMHMQHPLTLLAKPAYKTRICVCNACGKYWKNFTYHCSSCQFDLDILCVLSNRKFDYPSHNHPPTFVHRPSSLECSASHEQAQKIQQLKHFSHEQHPLTLLLEAHKDEQTEEPICYGCRKPTSSDLTYACRQCRIFFHKRCAELPMEIEHPMHSEHPLTLLIKPPYESGSCRCQVCKKPWSNFVYNCSYCEFDIDILCALLDREFELPSHNHPMMLVQRPASFKCNACDVEGFDESYLCTNCSFWIHKGCGLLPQTIKREDHDHPLSLVYCLPIQYRGYGFMCEICLKELRPSIWIYYCGPCKYFVHFKCITEKAPEPELPPFARTVDIFLPNKDPVEHALRYYLENFERFEGRQLDLKSPEVKVYSHKHSLVLSEAMKECNSINQEEIICDGCIEPISSSYYRCEPCSFFLHITCANLPTEEPNPGHSGCRGERKLKLYFPQNTWEVVKCNFCNSFCSGYGYKCEECNFFIDVKCSCLMGVTEHRGHRHRLLPEWPETPSAFMCSGCGVSKSGPYFSCSACGFNLGHECAVLPATVKHRWDKHELILSFPPFTDVPDQFYCEVCEEEIHPKRRIYRCGECDQSFHPHCIPSLGASRNIKFGRTLAIQGHPHRLIIVPDGNLNMCAKCHISLYWQKAFECAPCRFYLCSDCIAKEEHVD